MKKHYSLSLNLNLSFSLSFFTICTLISLYISLLLTFQKYEMVMKMQKAKMPPNYTKIQASLETVNTYLTTNLTQALVPKISMETQFYFYSNKQYVLL